MHGAENMHYWGMSKLEWYQLQGELISFKKRKANTEKELERLEGLDYEYFYVPRLSITELRTYVAKQKADRGIGWIVIDYVSLLTVPGITDKNERDEAMSAELRRIT